MRYNGNTEFFAKSSYSKLTLKDVFSDVLKKHTKKDTEQLFMAGTSSTTPTKDRMLSEWKKPWLFFRILLLGLAFLVLLYVMVLQGYAPYAISPFAFLGSAVVPFAILLFYWEMNIPRNIPIYQVLIFFLFGGVISLIFTGMINNFIGDYPAPLAALTEEPAKLLATYVFLKRNKRNYIFNGLLIGGAVGAGFAVIETSGYFLNSNLNLYNLITRSIMAPGGHVAWAAIYGGALAWVQNNNNLTVQLFSDKRFLKYFGLSVLLHFIWNSEIYICPLPLIGDVKFLILIIIAWIALLRIMKLGVEEVLLITNYNNNQANRNFYNLSVYGVSGMYKGKEIPITKGNLIFGRDSNVCNVVFPKSISGISRRHCTLSFDGYNLWICDNESTYGTYLSNGAKLSSNNKTKIPKGEKFYLADLNTMFEVR